MKKNRLFLLNIVVTSMTLFACHQEPTPEVEPPKELDIIESQYTTQTYKDYEKYSLYTAYGYPIKYSPSIGTTKILVVPVWFTDSTDFIALDHRENVRDDIRTSYFGSEEETGWESVKTYYEKDSFGRITIEGSVSEWYETEEASTAYHSDTGKTETLLRSVIEWAKENVEDYASYDTDKDGFIDGICLIYAAYDMYGIYYSTGKYRNTDNMWAYTSWLGDENQRSLTNPGANNFFWSSYDFLYNGFGQENYEFTTSRTGKGWFGNGDISSCIVDSHTFIHETGHLFGLNDYYDYNNIMSPALGFSMQDMNVGAHDPHSRFVLGWSKAIVPTETCRVRVKPMEESGEFILLSPNFNGSAFSEYIAVELFTKTGLNEQDCLYPYQGTPHPDVEYGVRLWHVDARLYKVTSLNALGTPNKGYVTDDVTAGSVIGATSNTSYVKGEIFQRAIKYAGSYDYNELQVIRRNYQLYDENGEAIRDTFQRSAYITDEDFFVTGDTFDMHDYRSQFVQEEKLNSGLKLGWSIYFEDVSAEGMTVVCTKL